MSNVRAVDCHAHVFCDASYAFAADTVYTPDPSQRGTAASFLAVLDAHGLTHGLLVAAQPYGELQLGAVWKCDRDRHLSAGGYPARAMRFSDAAISGAIRSCVRRKDGQIENTDADRRLHMRR